MDDYKRGTSVNYTSWDLNCRRFVKFSHGQAHKLKKMFARMFRRTDKQKVKELRGEE